MTTELSLTLPPAVIPGLPADCALINASQNKPGHEPHELRQALQVLTPGFNRALVPTGQGSRNWHAVLGISGSLAFDCLSGHSWTYVNVEPVNLDAYALRLITLSSLIGKREGFLQRGKTDSVSSGRFFIT
jgi:hypothetical protein